MPGMLMGPSEACAFGQPSGLWNLQPHQDGPTTDLILWHILCYDKSLGVSNRPALGRGATGAQSSQLQQSYLNPRSCIPRRPAGASN